MAAQKRYIIRDYSKIIRSPQVTFLIGKDRVPLKIHAGVVEIISDRLHDVIRTREDGVVALAGVDEDVFLAFCEYAYTGTYSTPCLDEEATNAAAGGGGGGGGGGGVHDQVRTHYELPADSLITPSKKRKIGQDSDTPVQELASTRAARSPRYEALWNKFCAWKYHGGFASVSPRPDVLFHAKLCVFAEEYLIGPLYTSCLGSLHRDLCSFSLNSENMSLIITLLGYIYMHPTKVITWRTPLRNLVIYYIACEAETLIGNEGFMKMLEAKAQIGADLVSRLVRSR